LGNPPLAGRDLRSVLAPLVAVPLGTARSVAAGGAKHACPQWGLAKGEALANCLGIHALEAIQVHEQPF